ncbi:hypothetical protein PHYSODRAFT_255951 [Phytophthora sojae]|uniref:Uncharacterized protein n=1 Tax=Phytophthora sojae (strain P6497) TaxID=1094619 RepID=G5A7V5_PHYSP|nr:hypothetical protein PHYSODRAFT_255951 [Phytophthora sojae]EGZ07981.1 hypothetical protein PHYSODRAFT_255951 [Phytophthora sojae]|eukprot:XP_009536153.1 hypothetical protein PHYSODRAFT_255951 [Phytophthora sojae]
MFKVRMAEYRQRRRAIQQRYKQRMVEKTVVLEEDVVRLRKEIQQLERKQSNVDKGVVMKTEEPAIPDNANVHRRFLQAAMEPDVIFNGGCGVEAALENWRLVSLHHEVMDIQLVRVEEGLRARSSPPSADARPL